MTTDWISVKDRLPEEDDYYLLANETNVFTDFVFEQEIFLRGKAAYYNIEKRSGHRFTHWMPLPEPPEDDNDQS
jgi:hypothetical protein